MTFINRYPLGELVFHNKLFSLPPSLSLSLALWPTLSFRSKPSSWHFQCDHPPPPPPHPSIYSLSITAGWVIAIVYCEQPSTSLHSTCYIQDLACINTIYLPHFSVLQVQSNSYLIMPRHTSTSGKLRHLFKWAVSRGELDNQTEIKP